uniref:Transmembrane protein n=1 Tax=Globodera pallida TaxID=36090 RepID=A0A183BJ62_GLOPA
MNSSQILFIFLLINHCFVSNTFCQTAENGVNLKFPLIHPDNSQHLKQQQQLTNIGQKRRRRGTFVKAALGGAALGGGIALLAKAFRQRNPSPPYQRQYLHTFG